MSRESWVPAEVAKTAALYDDLAGLVRLVAPPNAYCTRLL